LAVAALNMSLLNLTYIPSAMEFYSAIKKDEILSFAGKWMELKIILSEVNQVKKAKSLMFFPICGI
jgi:hypothetical protein